MSTEQNNSKTWLSPENRANLARLEDLRTKLAENMENGVVKIPQFNFTVGMMPVNEYETVISAVIDENWRVDAFTAIREVLAKVRRNLQSEMAKNAKDLGFEVEYL